MIVYILISGGDIQHFIPKIACQQGIPDRATFWETVQKLIWLDKVRGILSLAGVIRQTLTYCIFQTQRIFIKLEYEENLMKHWVYPFVNLLELHVFLTLYLKIKSCHEMPPRLVGLFV